MTQHTKHIIIMLSPRNSHFTKETISKLVETNRHAESASIMIADKPAEHTYRALGYSASKAARKARLACNRLRNYSAAVIEHWQAQITIPDWDKNIASTKAYQEALHSVQHLFEENIAFRKDAEKMTLEVIGLEHQERLAEGVQYLLEELAYLTASPCIHHAQQTVCIYHRPWPIYEHYIAGHYDGQPKPELHFEQSANVYIRPCIHQTNGLGTAPHESA